MVETDGRLVAVGYTNAEDRENTFFAEGRGYLAFLDPEGSKIGGRSLRDELAQAYRIAKHGQALIISGLVWNEDDNLDFGLLKLNADGSRVWGRLFGGTRDDHCFGMDLGADGSIFLTGHTLSGTVNWQTYTMKLDHDGILHKIPDRILFWSSLWDAPIFADSGAGKSVKGLAKPSLIIFKVF